MTAAPVAGNVTRATLAFCARNAEASLPSAKIVAFFSPQPCLSHLFSDGLQKILFWVPLSPPGVPNCTLAASLAASAAVQFVTHQAPQAHTTKDRANSIAGMITFGFSCLSVRCVVHLTAATCISSHLSQACCSSVTTKYSCNDWGQVICSSHKTESSQCFDCGRYITALADLSARQRLLQFMSSSAREALFSEVTHSGSPSPPSALGSTTNHVTCIVDMGRTVDERTQVFFRVCTPFHSDAEMIVLSLLRGRGRQHRSHAQHMGSCCRRHAHSTRLVAALRFDLKIAISGSCQHEQAQPRAPDPRFSPCMPVHNRSHPEPKVA